MCFTHRTVLGKVLLLVVQLGVGSLGLSRNDARLWPPFDLLELLKLHHAQVDASEQKTFGQKSAAMLETKSGVSKARTAKRTNSSTTVLAMAPTSGGQRQRSPCPQGQSSWQVMLIRGLLYINMDTMPPNIARWSASEVNATGETWRASHDILYLFSGGEPTVA